MSPPATVAPVPAPRRSVRMVAMASLVGTTIEWYDFFFYGTAAALVFNRLFFPTFDPLAGTLAAFGTYAVGFVARPVGGIIIFSIFAGMPEDQFLAWGWRVPFLLSVVLVGVGLLIRIRLFETPAFEKLKEAAVEARQPIVEVIRMYPRQVLLAMGARVAENGPFYIYSVFAITYVTQRVNLDQQTVLNGILLGAACELVAIPVFGALSDRFGRRPVYLFGALVTALFAYPLFLMLDTGSSPMIWLALVIAFVFSHAAMYAPQAAFLSELFGTRVRYSGASLGAQLASVFAGGLAPFVATGLLQAGYGGGAIALYVIGLAMVTIVAVLAASETAGVAIERH